MSESQLIDELNELLKIKGLHTPEVATRVWLEGLSPEERFEIGELTGIETTFHVEPAEGSD